jgi:RNA polymerase sigma-70 factor (ECF subfamily)
MIAMARGVRDPQGASSLSTWLYTTARSFSVAAVKSRLHRARLAVRASLLPTLGIPADATAADTATASSCPDVLTMYSQKLEGEISASLCSEMEKHVESCSHCTRACDSLKRSLALCSTAPSVDVPRDVQASVRIALRKVLADPA